MSLFTYIKYPVEPDCWNADWYKTIPDKISEAWVNHPDIRHLSRADTNASQAELNKRVLDIRTHNILLLKKIILEWEDDSI